MSRQRGDFAVEMVARLVFSVLLTPVVRYLPPLWGWPLTPWGLAFIVALVLVFLGELVLREGVDW